MNTLKTEVLEKNPKIKSRESEFEFSESYALKKSRRVLTMKWADENEDYIHTILIMDQIPHTLNRVTIHHSIDGVKIRRYERVRIDRMDTMIRKIVRSI